MSTPTSLDVLRYIKFHAGWQLDTIVDALYCDLWVDEHPELERLTSLSGDINSAAALLPGVDWSRYSDGRRVWSEAQIDRGHTYIHLWHPDPAKNEPRVITGQRLADPGVEAGTYEIRITPPGSLEVKTFPPRLRLVPQ